MRSNRHHNVAVLLILSGALVLAACGSSSKTSTGTATTTTTSSSGSGSSASGATVQVSDNATKGKILVDDKGMTLYVFAKDNGTTSACTAAPCLPNWPGYTSSGSPTAGPGVDSSKLGTASGQVPKQVTYGGHLLYHFVGDSKPGDVNGAAIPNWSPIGADGKPITSSMSTTTTTTSGGSSGGY